MPGATAEVLVATREYQVTHDSPAAKPAHPDDTYRDLPPTPRGELLATSTPENPILNRAANRIRKRVRNLVIHKLVVPKESVNILPEYAYHNLGGYMMPRTGECRAHVLTVSERGQMREGYVREGGDGKFEFDGAEYFDEQRRQFSPGLRPARSTTVLKHTPSLVKTLFDRLERLKATMERNGGREADIARAGKVLDGRKRFERTIRRDIKSVPVQVLDDAVKAEKLHAA